MLNRCVLLIHVGILAPSILGLFCIKARYWIIAEFAYTTTNGSLRCSHRFDYRKRPPVAETDTVRFSPLTIDSGVVTLEALSCLDKKCDR